MLKQHSVVVTACNHRYHEDCITRWLKSRSINQRTCAKCRRIAVPLVREAALVDGKETNPLVESRILRAVRTGQREFIVSSLSANPGIVHQRFHNIVFGNKIYLLAIAAQNGHRELVADLLNAGANPGKKKQIFRPLVTQSIVEAARINGHDNIVQMLLDSLFTAGLKI